MQVTLVPLNQALTGENAGFLGRWKLLTFTSAIPGPVAGPNYQIEAKQTKLFAALTHLYLHWSVVTAYDQPHGQSRDKQTPHLQMLQTPSP